MAEPDFDDIDLDLEDDIEFKKLLEGGPPTQDINPETPPEPETPETPPETEEDRIAQLTAQIQEERRLLEEKLAELAVSNAMQGRKVEDLTKQLASSEKKEEKVDEGPSPEEVMSAIDNRIAQVDAALAKAEIEDPSKAPALRQQLRQLERYAIKYQTTVDREANAPIDPADIASKAASDAALQMKFNYVTDNIKREYPALDPASPDFNQDLQNKVHRFFNPMLQVGGTDPIDALIEATTTVMRGAGVLAVSEVAQLEQQKSMSEAEKAAAEKAAADASTRKEDAITRNIQAANMTPPNLASQGESNKPGGILEKYDFGKMSINDMLRLPDDVEEQIENALYMWDGDRS